MSSARQGYPSDLTDEQWVLIRPLLPALRTGVKGGRREKHPRRQIVDAILYVARTGCQWRCLPHDLPPWPTVYGYFTWWHDDGAVNRVRAVHFFVGNIAAHPRTFMLLGLFYPQRRVAEYVQDDLFTL
ncbi:Putative transposase of IS4/5 family [Streptomyces sp. DvalAA-14]|nr:transposase [Streptomyces sp. SID4948]SCE17194.1 Putative transposase of IS4/5 family [Streptomyces sp. DvalAA-14]